jgi:hypothetical protein
MCNIDIYYNLRPMGVLAHADATARKLFDCESGHPHASRRDREPPVANNPSHIYTICSIVFGI